MAITLIERIELLKAVVQPVLPEDTLAEAGRKVLLAEFIKMLKHESGSRTGEDVEDVHDMRVAMRRMRSVFRLLGSAYKRGDIRRFVQELRRQASALGNVRDLDVLIENLRAFQQTLEADQQADLQTVIDELDVDRTSYRKDLNDILDSKSYRRFVKDFAAFLTKPGAGVIKATHDDGVVPSQLRHLLPGMIYNHLAAVRAYETVLEEAGAETLHALRIECKRLRYTVSLFDEVLGSQIGDFIEELKALQDCLGHLNDAATARIWLEAHTDEPVIAAYIAGFEAKETALKEQFVEIWARFNSRRVQQKLSSAVLALR
ncbi:MAG: CHAD domain-containing protein [Anaerolineae bacterium]|nr:CHAD domain-containing protein [Anaerolineae bacterium]